jgi:hypothetical protein
MFERQPLHYLLLALLLVLLLLLRTAAMTPGTFRGLSADTWFWLSIGAAVAHQVYVWFIWRAELHHQFISRLVGRTWGFRLYAVDFSLFLLARGLTILGLARANAGALAWGPPFTHAIALALLIPWLYLAYSVLRYFGLLRAMGRDHFEPAFRNRPLVREGIYRVLRNPMYAVGFLILYLPGLLLRSPAALLAAAFQHAYIWVHYACTELPDMRRIYGERVR